MPKKPQTFRLSDEHIAILSKYQTDHSLSNTTEALEQILDTKDSPPARSSNSGASDLLPCRQRLTIDNELSCMNPPTLYRKVRITEITPEICRACQILSKNLPDKYEVKQTPSQETFDRAREPVTDPKRKDMPKDMTWCPEGLWVVKTKCVACRAKNYASWWNCQKQGYLKRDELQRASS